MKQELQPAAQALRRILEECPQELEQREAEILKVRMGIPDGTPKPAEQVAERFGLTTERVRQIEAGAMRRISRGFRRRVPEEFLKA